MTLDTILKAIVLQYLLYYIKLVHVKTLGSQSQE